MGRQPLSFGDERLIGVDDPWSNRSQRFDGAVVSWSNPQWRWDVFSATLAPSLPNSLDPISAKDRVSGAYGHWSTDRHHLLFEPFVFWTRKRQPLPGGETPGQWSIWTPGMRLGTDLPFGLTFASETVLQGGHGVGRSIGAWASAVTIARHIGGGDRSPEISAGYNFASGDRSQYDGHQGTFDDLYPAGYNGCGSLDPFAWRNLRDVTWGADWRPRGNWHLAAEVHHYWLATTRDGLYADEGGYLVFAPQASSSRIGSQANVMAQYKRSSFWDISLGYARLFAGPYLRETGLGIALNSVFLNLAFRI